MKICLLIFLYLICNIEGKNCPCDSKPPSCPKGEVYLEKGPGPYCYRTCCGPRAPPCYVDSFTSGCFCASVDYIKLFPVTNNSIVEPNNPCIPAEDCNSEICQQSLCTLPNEEYRACGPTSMCDNQVCRGARPICDEEQAQICVAGCFCKEGFSRFNGECIKQCPLLP